MFSLPDNSVAEVEFVQSFDLTQRGEYENVVLTATLSQLDGIDLTAS